MSNLTMSWIEEGGALQCRWSEKRESRRYMPIWMTSDAVRMLWLPRSPQFGLVFAAGLGAIQWCVPVMKLASRLN